MQPRVFGEMVVVTDRTSIKSKLADRGKACVWVGYAADHGVGTHHVLNPATKKISLTRDVIFLRQNYRNWKEKKELDKKREVQKPPPSMLKNAEEDNIGKERDRQIVPRPHLVRHVSNLDEEDEKPATSSRLLGELRRLNVSYNPVAKSELDRLDGLTPRNSNLVRVNRIQLANIVRDVSMESQIEKVTTQYVEPRTFEEAWNHPDPKQREFWRSAIRNGI